VANERLPPAGTGGQAGDVVLADTLHIAPTRRQRKTPRATRQPRRSKAPASPFRRRAQLRKFLQRLVDGPVLNASRVNTSKDVLAAFAKLLDKGRAL
jgi:hypothetical protein